MSKFKLGLIGCGNMMATHVRGVNQLEEVEIVAVCDIIRERAETVAESLGNHPKVVLNYTELTDDVDGVLIALPHDLHFECGMYFARKNKHILMEKPLCNSEEECQCLIDECEAHNVTLMCAYPVRFWPGVVKLKEIIDAETYGKVFMMSVWTEQLTGADWKNEEISSWGRTARLGGGQLFSHGCHYVDILLWFLGEPVSGTHQGTNLGTPWMLREGTSAMTMKFENGAVAYHGATWGARGTRLGYDFQLHCEKAMVEYDHMAGEIRLYDRNQKHTPGSASENKGYSVLWTREGEMSKDTQFEIVHFVECAVNGKRPLVDGKRALQSLRVIWSLYHAEKSGMVADLRGLGLSAAE